MPKLELIYVCKRDSVDGSVVMYHYWFRRWLVTNQAAYNYLKQRWPARQGRLTALFLSLRYGHADVLTFWVNSFAILLNVNCSIKNLYLKLCCVFFFRDEWKHVMLGRAYIAFIVSGRVLHFSTNKITRCIYTFEIFRLATLAETLTTWEQ